MENITILLFYDSGSSISKVEKDEIMGITYIDIKDNKELYKKRFLNLIGKVYF